MGIYSEMANQRDRLERATKALEKELRVLKKQARKSKIIRMKNGSVEIVLVEREGFQVRAPLNDDGSICSEYIRVVDSKKRGKELAYWSHDEFMESDDAFDPSTALAAAFSVIELVFSGQYPPRERGTHG